MFEPLIQSINSYASLSQQEIDDFTGRISLQQYEKDTCLLDIGEICMEWGFIASGSFREYYLNSEMDEVTTNLFTENDWVLNHQSFTGQKPSKCRIEAFEDSKVLKLNVHDLHDLIGKSPAFFALGKILEVETKFPQSASPEEKYLKLIKEKPELIQKFPLKYIASYMSITPETLSRVRARIQ